MLKRYLVFAFNEYYPNGGWDDLQGSADTIEEALAFLAYALDRDARFADYQSNDEEPPSRGLGWSVFYELDRGYVIDLTTGEKTNIENSHKGDQ